MFGVTERSLAYITHQLRFQTSPFGITSQLSCNNSGQLISLWSAKVIAEKYNMALNTIVNDEEILCGHLPAEKQGL